MEKNDEMNTITDFNPEAVIIDAGEFPSNPIALRWLEGRPIVCCDGAANSFSGLGYPIWRIVGDGDSMSEEIRKKYASIIRRNPDQETNDQTKSVEYLAARGISRIVILGATGRREDHTIGNISLLVEYLKRGIEARIYTDYGVFIPVEGKGVFHSRKGAQLSIFNFGAKKMRSEGLIYPIRDFDSWWQGTLNAAAADTFSIEAEGYYIVYLNYEMKNGETAI